MVAHLHGVQGVGGSNPLVPTKLRFNKIQRSTKTRNWHRLAGFLLPVKKGGYNLRNIIDQMDSLRFQSQIEKHELSELYEAKIKNMGNAGRNGGEYYTPRPLIRAMIHGYPAENRRENL